MPKDKTGLCVYLEKVKADGGQTGNGIRFASIASVEAAKNTIQTGPSAWNRGATSETPVTWHGVRWIRDGKPKRTGDGVERVEYVTIAWPWEDERKYVCLAMLLMAMVAMEIESWEVESSGALV